MERARCSESDAEAWRYLEKALRLCADLDSARALISELEEFGEGSAAWMAASRVLGLPEGAHHAVLMVGLHATEEQLRKAYRGLSRELHPDRNRSSGAEEAFKRLSHSYSVLASEFGRRDALRPTRDGSSGASGANGASHSPRSTFSTKFQVLNLNLQ